MKKHKLLSTCIILLLILVVVRYVTAVAVDTDTGADVDSLNRKIEANLWATHLFNAVVVVTIIVIIYEIIQKRRANAREL